MARMMVRSGVLPIGLPAIGDPPRLVVLTMVLALTGIIGCGPGGGQSIDSNAPAVRVLYDGQPIESVQVRLHADASGPPIAQAISSSDGHARFAELPEPQPEQYVVSLISLSDGGWILDDAFASPGESELRLPPLRDAEPATLRIPSGAIQPLMPRSRR